MICGGESGQAVAVVASSLLEYLQAIKGAWEALSDATRGEQAASKPTVKKRALRVVETDEGETRHEAPASIDQKAQSATAGGSRQADESAGSRCDLDPFLLSCG